ncbi:ABC transporter permease [Neobacillus sp. PS3-40]|uniref:ABC transporter permease n=1 Tax=Neobacillus sp. PS3-40 TaxID=3070679 RepID=UPI0027DF4E96|nr:ABC transporter permease [Neobacillus sp. PS3-40]WML42821.1 ABC transporter permease [Neobacillus sp. PS3-40]
MKSLIIAWKDFKIRFTDRKGFFLMILFPILLTAILGSALSGVMGEESLPKTTVGIFQNDHDQIASTFVNDVLKGKELNDLVSVKKVDSEKKLKSFLQDEKVDVGIVIPSTWSKDLQQGKLKQVKLIVDPGKELKGTIIETILQTFVNRVDTISSSTKIILTNSAPFLSPSDMKDLSTQLIGSLEKVASSNSNYVKQGSVGKKQVSGMQYYAAAMAAMFLLFNVMNGVKSFINERETETLARLMSTPTSKFSVLVGKFLGILYFVIAQFSIFLIVTHLLFQINWGDNILQTILVAFAYSIAVSGLAMLFAAMITNSKTADTVGGIGVQVFSLLGGSMIPITVFPKTLQTISNIAPNKWALSSFIDIMSGTTWDALFLPMVVLLLIGMVSVTIGTWRLQVK